jgi:hypothetical protein
MKRLALLLAVSFLSPLQPVDAQRATNQAWVTLGMGGSGNGKEDPSVNFGGEFALQHGDHLFSGRFFYFAVPFGILSEASETALLYGRARQGRRSQVALTAGIAFLRCQDQSLCGTGRWTPDENPDFEHRVGLALSGQAFWTPFRVFGIGLYGFGNINPTQSFFGAMLGLRLGRLRD